MTKRWQQILAGYVALCVAFAGAIGLSPGLHGWLEHGGAAARHTHAHGLEHWHAPSAPLPQAHGQFRAAAPSSGLALPESSPTLLGFKPQDLFHLLTRALARWGDHDSPAPEPPSGHQHFSLAQMLLNGAVEVSVATPLLAAVLVPADSTPFPLGRSLVAAIWYAPAASRPPPVPAGPVS